MTVELQLHPNKKLYGYYARKILQGLTTDSPLKLALNVFLTSEMNNVKSTWGSGVTICTSIPVNNHTISLYGVDSNCTQKLALKFW